MKCPVGLFTQINSHFFVCLPKMNDIRAINKESI